MEESIEARVATRYPPAQPPSTDDSNSSSANRPASPSVSDSTNNHNFSEVSSQSDRPVDTTPPSSINPTPDEPSALADPFASLSISDTRQKTVQPIQSDHTTLTAESLRPLDPYAWTSTSKCGASKNSASSVASSSEAHDFVGPLPTSRQSAHHRRTSVNSTRSAPPLPTLPLPSPPALGLSELLSGSPRTPGNEDSYFPIVTEPTTTLRRNNSAPRKAPHYSPFRSYYGHPQQYEVPEFSPALEARPNLDRQPSNRAQSEIVSTVSGETSRKRRSPRVRNDDGILAPHGSFSNRAAPTAPRQRDSERRAPASDSHLYVGSMRRPLEDPLVDESRRAALEESARKGDQLAMYRLGWRSDVPRGQRYHLGSVESIWGPSSPDPSSTRRSSNTSQQSSLTSATASPVTRPAGEGNSDLFSDAATLALRSSALQKNHRDLANR